MKSYEILVKTNRKDIDIINKIIEAFEGIATVRISSKEDEILRIITTYDYILDIKKILKLIEEYGVNLKIIEEKEWEGRL